MKREYYLDQSKKLEKSLDAYLQKMKKPLRQDGFNRKLLDRAVRA